MRPRRPAALVLVASLVAPLVLAGERAHVVRSGESASAIAERSYGDSRLGTLLLAFNGRRGTTIHAGETLRLPYSDVHRVRSGDSWSALTRRYLGSSTAWQAVAELNGLAPDQPLRVGQELVFPVVLEHRLERGATLAVLAERYYGDATRGRLLQEFNRLEDPRRLAVGATVRVPLTSLRLRRSDAPAPVPTPAPAPQPPVARAAVATPSPTPVATPSPTELVVEAQQPAPVSYYMTELAAAEGAFRRAEFESALTLLEELREPVSLGGTPAERRELLRLLSFVYVAFDNEEEACAAYGALTRLDGAPTLDPDLVSPKIRALLSACVSPA